ncbi:dTDP-glucose 4,6-dehydratase [Bordetella petrii]|uniref:dTDP-glucose 4,6-dehydratase n=1 Tax=Bordetella petrii TaxID=94624 RepID=UPI001E617676|nr:dTDP-glucose 4,6-dehydratase [Bordetella petrii]MCD0504123.1 dTDP-glucose 4,6-dehydratase [Bordetella petrii]
MSILVTGGAGFIGSNFVLGWLAQSDEPVINLDKLTYAGHAGSLDSLRGDARHRLVQGDIADTALVSQLLQTHQPRAVLNFAAESHVDRAIRGPDAFIQTNVTGTFQLLEAVRGYWLGLGEPARAAFRYLQISTDEVYGSLDAQARAFAEGDPYRPNNPYSASKAAGDHLVRAYRHTYGLPVLTTHCPNNYGPRQFPEKLIPLLVHQALAGKPLPLYGDGSHVRDWLYVDDHCAGLRRALEAGEPGQVYHIGASQERSNLQVAQAVCALLDAWRPRADGRQHAGLITLVRDRPGHDRRYAVDAGKIRDQLGWQPEHGFDAGLRATVRWYLDHPEWVASVAGGAYRHWLQTHYTP